MDTDPDWTSMLRTKIQQSLSAFNASSSTFKVVHTVVSKHDSQSAPGTQHSTSPNPPLVPLKTLYVLDSSFNPPSRAHLTLARNALLHDGGDRPARLLFLLATENADKKAKPAAFEDRLVMMSLMASDLQRALQHGEKPADRQASPTTSTEALPTIPAPPDDRLDVDVDIAVTKKPFFMDKAASIDAEGGYAGGAQQVHLTGYDTIVRIFDTKYYPEDEGLRVLEPFLSRHRLRVCYREGDGMISHEEQREYVESIADGRREDEGAKKEWAKMIDLVDDAIEARGVSSTEARRAAVEGRREDLVGLVGEAVAEYVLRERFYDDPKVVKK